MAATPALSQRQVSVAQQQFLDIPDDGTMVACLLEEDRAASAGLGLCLGLTCLPANNFWGRVDSQKLQVKADVSFDCLHLHFLYLHSCLTTHYSNISHVVSYSTPPRRGTFLSIHACQLNTSLMLSHRLSLSSTAQR